MYVYVYVCEYIYRRKLREMFEDLKKSRVYAAEEAARKKEADEIYR
jgi:hypothetical protein